MTTQSHIDYKRVENAIEYIVENFKSNPSLDDIAGAIHVSPYHFQRLFSKWAGVSPKKFMQFVSLGYAKEALLEKGVTLLDAAYDAGLSGPSRLHDLFVNIEGMTPGNFKRRGAGLAINYSFAESPFGTMIIASTPIGVCHMAFEEDHAAGFETLRDKFPEAEFHLIADKVQQDALFIFQRDWSKLDQIKLHLQGTPFQLKVWEALLKVPMGSLATYGDIAREIGRPNASRAVGTAISKNPVAFLIPCHRVIQQTGKVGEYMWGSKRKVAMIGWEGAQVHAQ